MASHRSRGPHMPSPSSVDAQVLSLDGETAPNGESRGSARPKTPIRPTSSSGRSKAPKVTEFRKFLENEELPLRIESSKYGTRHRVRWNTNLEHLDFAHYLPLCLAGMQETMEPYPTFAYQAAMQLLENGLDGSRVLICLPLIIPPIKAALGTRDRDVVHRVLLVLQQLTVCDGVGHALTEYYRAILPLCNILQDRHLGTGDERTREMVADALETMEAYGKDDAQVLIQQYVPTFQSQYPSDRLVAT